MGHWWLAASMCPLKHHLTYRIFSWNIKLSMWFSPLYSSVFVPHDFWLFPKQNHLWKGRGSRLSMRFRKIQWGSWWRVQQRILQSIWTVEEMLGELCEVLGCLLWRWPRCHCPMYNVSSILYLLQLISLFFYIWLDTFWTDLVYVFTDTHICENIGQPENRKIMYWVPFMFYASWYMFINVIWFWYWSQNTNVFYFINRKTEVQKDNITSAMLWITEEPLKPKIFDSKAISWNSF